MHSKSIDPKHILDIIILGSGPAGLSAALYSARGQANTLVISGSETGGQLMLTPSIENYPGIITSGAGLVDNMMNQCKEFGVQFLNDFVTEIRVVKNTVISGLRDDVNVFELCTTQGVYYAKVVIIATGSKAKWLEVPGAEQFKGNGISTCATCDGWAYRHKTVAVIGGGNTAVEEAIYLSKACKEVVLIHRRNTLRAEKIMQKIMFAIPNIRYVWDSVVVEVHEGDGENETGNMEKLYGQAQAALSHVTIQNVLDHKLSTLHLDGIFVAIGHEPNTAFLANLTDINNLPVQSEHGSIKPLVLDQTGYIHTEHTVNTGIPGLYAAGDVIADSAYLGKQAVVAAATGCTAAMNALKFLTQM